MKVILWKCLFTALISFIFASTALANHATVWRTITPGLEYTRIDGFANFPQGYVHAFRINLDQYHLTSSLVPTDNTPETNFYRLMKAESAVIATNGGFFTPELKPLGLRISDAQLFNPLKSISWWRVFFIRDKKAYLVTQENYQPDSRITFAIQAGPRLVTDGDVVSKLKIDIDAHTAIGITKDGQIILLATENILLGTTDIAELMQRSEKEGGLNCREALNLDGGHSTQMYTKLPELSLTVSSHAQVADAILVVPNK